VNAAAGPPSFPLNRSLPWKTEVKAGETTNGALPPSNPFAASLRNGGWHKRINAILKLARCAGAGATVSIRVNCHKLFEIEPPLRRSALLPNDSRLVPDTKCAVPEIKRFEIGLASLLSAEAWNLVTVYVHLMSTCIK